MTRISSRLVLFPTAAVLIVAGTLSMIFLDSRGSPPVLVCAEEGGPTSGFADPTQGNCPTTIESFNAFAQWSSSPNLFAIAGLLAVLIGVVVGIIALVTTLRSARKAKA